MTKRIFRGAGFGALLALSAASAGCAIRDALLDGLFLGVSETVAATLTTALGAGM